MRVVMCDDDDVGSVQQTADVQVPNSPLHKLQVMEQRAIAAEEALQKSQDIKQELGKRLTATQTMARRSARRIFENKADFRRYKTSQADKGQYITRALADLRYVENFGEGLSRGVMTCPISLALLGRNDSVAMLQCACDCNCMVKEAFARKIIEKIYDKDQDDLTCLICLTKVDSIKHSTVEQAEISFAWRAVQRTIDCSSFDAVAERRVEYLEKQRAEQKMQDTMVFH